MPDRWKALSLWQPWATAIALGFKRIETRSWYTPYRGPLLIHAAKTREGGSPPAKWGVVPYGALVARCTLVDVIRAETAQVSDAEEQWGNFTRGRWAWLLSDVVPLVPPIPWRGRQGLFDVDLGLCGA